MPTVHDCERCARECPQRQLAREQAEKRMYVTNEFVALQKDIEAGKLVRVVEAHWITAECSERDGNANCSNCGQWDWDDAKYCKGCGAKMRSNQNEFES